jgi:hypothetical protein
MSPIRSACPGFSVMSRAMPLRLLSKPSTATRSSIGVSVLDNGVVSSSADDFGFEVLGVAVGALAARGAGGSAGVGSALF